MVWQPHRGYRETATVVKGFMEELDCELTEEPWLQAIYQLGVILHSVAGDRELGGDREEPL